MKNYLMLLALAVTVGFTSCDNDDDEVVVQSKTEMLTSKTWKFTARNQVTTDSTGAVIDTNTTVEDCEKDDTYKFTTDNKFTRDEGATKCDPADPQTENGNWAFTDNETKLMITSGGFSLPSEIVELTSSQMIIRTTIDFFGDKVVATHTYNAQ